MDLDPLRFRVVDTDRRSLTAGADTLRLTVFFAVIRHSHFQRIPPHPTVLSSA